MEEHLNYEQAAQLLGIKKSTLYSMVSHHRVPHVRLSGRMVRFPRGMLLDWLESNLVMPNDDYPNAEMES